jgi:hypothetical protein
MSVSPNLLIPWLKHTGDAWPVERALGALS